jgi:CelD/BcsL family acetyltransferase involved in cellulose biosynthesis
MVLKITEIRSPDEFRLFEKDWNRILHTSGEDEVFLRMEWLSAWWDTFGKGKKMLVLRVSDSDRIVGFAPFAITSRRLQSYKTLGFMGSGHSDRCAILAEDERNDVHAAVWEYVMGREGWDSIELRDMREDGATSSNIKKIYPDAKYGSEVSPYVTISGTYEDYLRRLKKKNRHGFERNWRRLSEKHTVTFGSRKPMDAKDDEFREFIRLGKTRWEGSDIESVLSDPNMVKLMELAVTSLAREGIPTLHYLKEGDRTIAVGLGFEYLNRYLCYLSGFDQEFSKYSPGSLLALKVLELCYSNGLKEVDFLRGAEAYKYRFDAVDRKLIHFSTSRAESREGILGRIAGRPRKDKLR